MANLELAKQWCTQGRLDDAMREVEGALRENPNNDLALYLWGSILQNSQRPMLAIQVYERLTLLVPGKWQVWSSLGRCLDEINQGEYARRCYAKALTFTRNNHILSNLSMSLINDNEIEQAEAVAREVLATEPANSQAHINLSFSLLHQCRYAEGYEEYEWGLDRLTWRDRRKYGLGEKDYDGSRDAPVIVYGEQGVGDQVAFMSMFAKFKAMADVEVVECHPRLEGLFRRSFPGLPVFGTLHQRDLMWGFQPQAKYRAAMSQMLRWTVKDVSDFPGGRFLTPDPDRLEQWRHLLATKGNGRPWAGIAWQGGIPQTRQSTRTINLEWLLPILRLPLNFVSLNYKDCQSDIQRLWTEHGIQVHNWPHGSQSHDMDDVAALVDSCDTVFSVCTAAAHFGGALAKPTYVLTHQKPHFHYPLAHERMPYYGDATRVFRRQADDELAVLEQAQQVADAWRADHA